MSEKLCLFCKHLKFDYITTGSSCPTCGAFTEGGASCTKKKWGEGDFMSCLDEDDFRKLMLRAVKCKLYEQVKGKGQKNV